MLSGSGWSGTRIPTSTEVARPEQIYMLLLLLLLLKSVSSVVKLVVGAAISEKFLH